MYVVKRNSECEEIAFDKILRRLKNLSKNFDKKLNLNITELSIKVIDQLYNRIETSKIDELSAEQCASMCTKHPDYSILASRIVISNLHKNTKDNFSEVVNDLYNFKDVNNKHVPLLDNKFVDIVYEIASFFNSFFIN